MNPIKMQGKIRKIIAESTRTKEDHPIDPRKLRARGYNVITATYLQTCPDRNVANLCKPKSPYGSTLVLISECLSRDKNEIIYSKCWAEIPKDMIPKILALNHLPYLKS
jgi:hypothetical protein